MQKTLMTLAAVALMTSGAMAAGHVFADSDNPKQAKAFKSEVVRRFKACTTPNTKSSSLSLLACTPAATVSNSCAFNNIDGKDAGKGVLKTTVVGSVAANNGDIKVEAQLSGLSTGCEGHVLCPAASVRVTSKNGGCSLGGDCTLADLSDFQVGFDDGNAFTFECCTVLSGKCKIKTTVNDPGNLGPQAIPTGKKTSFELQGVSLKDMNSTPSGKVVFDAGAFVP